MSMKIWDMKRRCSCMIDLCNTLLEKNAPDMIKAAIVSAAMQTVQTESVVRLEASQR